jgi:hypothetical protein
MLVPNRSLDLETRWAAIQEKMAANARWLVRRGSLTTKRAYGKRFWVLRFDRPEQGRACHRTIYIGREPELLRRTCCLLQQYRSRALWEKEVAAYAQLVGLLRAVLERLRPKGNTTKKRPPKGPE